MEEKKSDEQKHVFQHLIRVTFYYSSANPSLTLTHDMESETAFSRKDSYTHYLSYDTLISSVAMFRLCYSSYREDIFLADLIGK